MNEHSDRSPAVGNLRTVDFRSESEIQARTGTLALGRPANPYELTVEAIDRFNRSTEILFKKRARSVELCRVYPTGVERSLGFIARADLRGWLNDPTGPMEFDDVGILIDHGIDRDGRVAFIFDNAVWVLSPMEEERLHKYL